MVVEKNHKEPEGYSLVSNSAYTIDPAEYARKFRNIEGMSWFVTCLFIVGETAGGGLIALPTAMVSAGLLGGIVIMIAGAVACAYTGVLLSENWSILQGRWPEYRTHCRKPYPAMGQRALGGWCATIVSSCLNVTMFGTAVVFLLLAAKNIENYLHAHGGIQMGFCYIVILVALFMLPFTMLKSPKDFWWAIIGAMVTTTIAVILILYGTAVDHTPCIHHVNYPPVRLNHFFMCFGTVMFAYGGHAAFPTIMADMKKPYHFKRACWLAFLVMFFMYMPVSVFGYLVYGDSLRDSVIPSIQTFPIQQIVNGLITIHVVLALTIIFNPLNQEFEEAMNISHEMGVGRVVSRTAMMIAVVFVAETVPNFGVLLDLVGGSTQTLMALVFPVIFNLYLNASKAKSGGVAAAQDEAPATLKDVWTYTSNTRKILSASILLFALIGGGAATISASSAMFNSEFSAPCYASLFTSKPLPNTLDTPIITNTTVALRPTGLFNCCGHSKNISRYGDAAFHCLDPSIIVGGGGSHG